MRAVYVRELAAYFLTPLAYVFIAIFLISLGAFTFEIGRFFETNQADLAPFFLFHPWLYLVFLPAIAMRLWADEARGGTLELADVACRRRSWSLVLGKFLAAWTVAGAALLLTTPMWISVNWLGASRQRRDRAYLCDELPDGGRPIWPSRARCRRLHATRWSRSCCRLRWASCSRRRACRLSRRGLPD